MALLGLKNSIIRGVTHVKIPTIEHIAHALRENKLVIVLATTCFLMGYPKYNFHFLIVSGIDDQFVYVTDSGNYNQADILQPLTGHYKHTHAQFIYGIHSATHGDIDNGSILVVSKK
jgi:hypothetical protein